MAILASSVQMIRGRIEPGFRLRAFDYCLLAYIALNFLSSALTSPQPHKTLVWACLNAIVVTPYFLIRLLVRNDRHVWSSLRVLLWIGLAEAIFGIAATVSNYLAGTTWGIELGQYGEIPGTYGTQFEANLFGSYSACCALMFLAILLLGKESRRLWYAMGVTFGMIAGVVSLARSVLLGLPIPILVLLYLSFRKGQLRLRQLLPLAIGGGILLLILSPFLVTYLTERFSTFGDSIATEDTSTAGRLIQLGIAVEHIAQHPILGQGTSSFQLLFSMADLGISVDYAANDAGWISNTPIRVLHDTGIVGLAAFLGFVGLLIVAAFRATQIAPYSSRLAIVALAAGLLLYAITFQASEATLLSFTWIHFGVLAAAIGVSLDNVSRAASIAQ
jgi:O-antigen ligase